MKMNLKKILSSFFIVAISFNVSAQVVLHEEDFEGAFVSWGLNSWVSGPTFTTTTFGGHNSWVVNNDYSGITVVGPPSISIPDTDPQPVGNITNAPNGNYLHTVSDTGVVTFGVNNSNYLDMIYTTPTVPEWIAATSPAISTVGYTGVEVDFWWIGGDTGVAATGGAQLYYRVNFGVWASTGVTLQSSTWQNQTFTNPLWDNVGSVQFAFVFNNDMGGVEFEGFGADQFVMTGLPPCQVDIGDDDQFICGGDSLLLTASTLTPTGLFQWNTGETTQSIWVTTPGTYTVDAWDSVGCYSNDAVNVIMAPPLGNPIVSITDASACLVPDGEIDITAAGGIPPYYYSIDGGVSYVTTNPFTGLSFGYYDVVVMDSTGCSIPGGTVLVDEPSTITIDNVVDADLGCNSLGSIDITASGGVATLYYSIDGGVSFSNTTGLFSNLTAGTYDVQVTDLVCTTIGSSYTFSDPSVTIDSLNVVDELCNGVGEGQIIIYASGGNGNLSYSINGGSTFAVTDTFTMLTAGTYDVIVSDNTCSDTVLAIISEPGSLYANANILGGYNGVGITCAGASTGVLFVETFNGTAPYSFVWYDSNMTILPEVLGVNSVPGTDAIGNPFLVFNDTITGVSAGTYYVEVIDANGCSEVKDITILENAPLTSVMLSDSVSCTNLSDGSAQVIVSGGIPPYSYQWSSGSTSDTANGLADGQYWLIVEDSLNCVLVDTVDIFEPFQLQVNATSTDVSCFGLNDGILTATPFNGTSGYTYEWTYPGYPIIGNTQEVIGVQPSTNYKYVVTVTDANGCTAVDSTWVGEPDPIQIIQIDTASAYCTQVPYGLNTGMCAVQATGGVPDAEGDYNFVWYSVGTFPGSWDNFTDNQSEITTTEAGYYQVLVTDSNGCQSNFTAVIPLVETLMLDTMHVTNNVCWQADDGSLTAFAIGGCGMEFPNACGYTYTWAGTPPIVSQTLPDLQAGFYSVTITDDNGCSITETAEVTEPDQILLSLNAIDQSCTGDVDANDGQIEVVISGGLDPNYDLTWFDDAANQLGTVNTTGVYTITGLTDGFYDVEVTDSNSCMGFVAFSSPDVLLVEIEAGYPVSSAIDLNPNVLDLMLDCYNVDNGHAEVDNPDANLNYVWYLDGNPIDAGTYTNSSGAGNLEVAAYYDGTLCETFSLPVTISEPPAIAVNAVITPESCVGANDGSIVLPNYYGDITGGTPYPAGWNPYVVSWDPSSAAVPGNFTLEDLAPGTYSLGVEDYNGCVYPIEFIINPAEPLLVSISNPNDAAFNGYWVDCAGDNTGRAQVNITGGQPAAAVPFYDILWSNSQTTGTATGLSAQTYSVTITDDNGCEEVATVQVTEPQPLSLDAIEVTGISCNGMDDGHAVVYPDGGVPNYAIGSISNIGAGTHVNITSLVPGVNAITVTDANNCNYVLDVNINEPAPLVLTTTTSMYGFFEVSCYGESDGVITASVTGGTADENGNYDYVLSGDGNNFLQDDLPVDFTSLTIGLYNVTVTDVNGCTDLSSGILLTQPDEITAEYTTDYLVAQPTPFILDFQDLSQPTILNATTPQSAVVTSWVVDGVSEVFGAGNFDNTQSYTFYSMGEHEVTIVATNNNGICSEEYTEYFMAQGLSENNVFSPNGDEINDQFSFENYGLLEMNAIFYNRWGEKVYEMFTPDASWDGVSMNGQEVPEGVYFYVLNAKGEDGSVYEEKGSVTIYR